jgi:hypothetical protein
LNKNKAHEILRAVPYEKGFHFFSPDGHYTGQTATTLCFFLRDLRHVGIESVRFHLSRGDFQKWLSTTIGDVEIAEKIDAVDKRASDEALLNDLSLVIENRIVKLKSIAP